jgi:hypothetical protein
LLSDSELASDELAGIGIKLVERRWLVEAAWLFEESVVGLTARSTPAVMTNPATTANELKKSLFL